MNFHTVLDFWFGLKQIDLKKGELAAWRYFESLSFDEVNTNLPRHFFSYVSLAGTGQLSSWLDEPKGSLALVLLLDQFPRYLYKNCAASYRFDQLALSYCRKSLAKEQDIALNITERLFLYMPLLHSESLEDQEEYQFRLSLMEPISDSQQQALLMYFTAKSEVNSAIIRKFGRFPHRNILLRRYSTFEELSWLLTQRKSP